MTDNNLKDKALLNGEGPDVDLGDSEAAKKAARRSKLLKYLIVSGAGIVVVFIFCLANGIFKADSVWRVWNIISDAFTIVGVIIAGAGALTWVSGKGAFDALGYGFKSLGVLFTPIKLRKDRMTYYDYMQRNKDKKVDVAFLLIIGGAFILIGIAAFIVYEKVAPENLYNVLAFAVTLA